MFENSIDFSILATLHYADIFNFPLKKEEIHRFLYQCSASLSQVENSLSELKKDGLVDEKQGVYFLSGRSSLSKIRLSREKISQQRFLKVLEWSRFCRFLPWIEMVGVSGSLAVGNSGEKDDLDLIIITSPQRLWLTRLLVVVFLKICGVYWEPHKNQGKFCPNVWLSRDDLTFKKQTAYLAHEITQTVPTYVRNSAYQDFIEKNHWVYKFFPNWVLLSVGTVSPFSLPSCPVLNLVEKWCYFFQVMRMRRKITREIITPSRALFHPADVSATVLSLYQNRLKALNWGERNCSQ